MNTSGENMSTSTNYLTSSMVCWMAYNVSDKPWNFWEVSYTALINQDFQVQENWEKWPYCAECSCKIDYNMLTLRIGPLWVDETNV